MRESKRLFFGLTLPDELRQAVVRWRADSFPAAAGYPVAAGDLCLTLAYLGELSEEKTEALIQLAGRIRQPGFTLTLDDAGHWPRSGTLWLGPHRAPRGLLQLADLLRSQAARSGCYQSPMPFHPHITLLRQATKPVALPARNFSWSFAVGRFVLYQSHFSRGRSRLKEIKTWLLQ